MNCRGFWCLALMAFSLASLPAQAPAQQEDSAAEPSTLEQLLELIRQGKVREDSEADQREEAFRSQARRQAQLLRQLQNRLKQERDLSVKLEQSRNENNLEIERLREQKAQKEGSLREIFGNLQAIASEAATYMETSLVTAQLGVERISYLRTLAVRMENTDKLPALEDIERLWYELNREMYESGRVVRFRTEVVGLDGVASACDVYRVSMYAVICNGRYVVLQPGGHLSELSRQPASRFLASARSLEDARDYVEFGIDPTGPQGNGLLKNLISSPNLAERVNQGGIIGRVILSLGALGVLLAIFKLLGLIVTGWQVNAQLRSETISLRNPLGRVQQVFEDHAFNTLEGLEAKLAQAVVRERKGIERFVAFLKIIATVAPLMGLLGTVTGMIITFQQITLYGTGDPKTMAGGISVALVTTVLGLTVAIPMVLLHTLVASRAKGLMSILEERSFGLIARQAEEEGAGKSSQRTS